MLHLSLRNLTTVAAEMRVLTFHNERASVSFDYNCP